MDKEQWDLLWTGEQDFWKTVPHLLAAGHYAAEERTEPRRSSTGQPYKIPRLMQCKDCGGASICKHNRVRSLCKDCGGASICEHNRVRSECKDCGGASICEQDRKSVV